VPPRPKGAGMLADDTPVLAQLDPVGIGAHLHRAADGAGLDRVLVVVEPHEAGLGDRRLDGVEPVEAALAAGIATGPLFVPLGNARRSDRLSAGDIARIFRQGVPFWPIITNGRMG